MTQCLGFTLPSSMSMNPVECPVCNGLFRNQIALGIHYDEYHRDGANDLKFKLTSSSLALNTLDDGLFCSELNSRRNIKSGDFYSNHSDDDTRVKKPEALLIPPFCNLDPHQLNNVFYNITKETWDCGICRKPFREKNDLYQHLRSGTHEAKRFSCGDCGKAFASIGALAQHVEQSGHSRGGKNVLNDSDLLSLRPKTPMSNRHEVNVDNSPSSRYSTGGGDMYNNNIQVVPSQIPPMILGGLDRPNRFNPPLINTNMSYNNHNNNHMNMQHPMEINRYTSNNGSREMMYPPQRIPSPGVSSTYRPPQLQQQQQQQHQLNNRYPESNRPLLNKNYTDVAPVPRNYSFNSSMHTREPIEGSLYFCGMSTTRTLDAACAWIIRDERRKMVLSEGGRAVHQTYLDSLLPDYEGLHIGLMEALAKGITHLRVMSDNELLLMHLNKSTGLNYWQTIYRNVEGISHDVRMNCDKFQEISFHLISKENNNHVRMIASHYIPKF